MTERIRELLDEAVAGVRPRDPDPAPELRRRGRRSQRLHLAAGGATVAAVVTLAAVVGIAVNRPAASLPAAPPGG